MRATGAGHFGNTSTLVLDGAAIAILLALSVVVGLDVTGIGRVLLTLAFSLYVPGRAVVTNWSAALEQSELALSVIVSLSIVTLLAAVSLWVHAWHPEALFAVEAGASASAIILARWRHFRSQQGEAHSRDASGQTLPLT